MINPSTLRAMVQLLDDPDLEILGASSDMLIVNLGLNKNNYKVGDSLSFNLKYMGALSLLNSNYIEKAVV